MRTLQKEKLNIFNFLALTIAGIVNATGITFFLQPMHLYDSGISGTSMFLSMVTPLPLSIFLLIFNIPLFLYGLKRQGKVFTIYAIYTVAIYSVTAWLITDILPIDVSITSPLAGSDLFLCALFGGLLSGAGSGMAIRFGGAMDGIEVMAVIFAKKMNLTVGSFVMIYNVILYITCGIVFQSWVLPLYSIITYFVGLKTIDFIVDGLDRAKAADIVTTRPEDVCAALSEVFGCGITVIEAKGWYSRSKKTIVRIIINRFQINKMKTVVHEQDPSAYISISEVADVFRSQLNND